MFPICLLSALRFAPGRQTVNLPLGMLSYFPEAARPAPPSRVCRSCGSPIPESRRSSEQTDRCWHHCPSKKRAGWRAPFLHRITVYARYGDLPFLIILLLAGFWCLVSQWLLPERDRCAALPQGTDEDRIRRPGHRQGQTPTRCRRNPHRQEIAETVLPAECPDPPGYRAAGKHPSHTVRSQEHLASLRNPSRPGLSDAGILYSTRQIHSPPARAPASSAEPDLPCTNRPAEPATPQQATPMTTPRGGLIDPARTSDMLDAFMRDCQRRQE